MVRLKGTVISRSRRTSSHTLLTSVFSGAASKLRICGAMVAKLHPKPAEPEPNRRLVFSYQQSEESRLVRLSAAR